MVVRDPAPMADSLVCTELRAPLRASPVDSSSVDALLPSVEPHHRVLVATAGDAVGLKLHARSLSVLTSVMSSTLRGAKIRNADGMTSSLRKSDDDDGYSSRSSLDSPVQASRPDGIACAMEDASELFEAKGSCGNLSSSDSSMPESLAADTDEVTGDATLDCDACTDTVGDSGLSDRCRTLAAVASLDHAYLVSEEPHDELPVASDVNSVASDDKNTMAAALSSASFRKPQRNISVLVLPQQSSAAAASLRWRARIVPVETNAATTVTSASSPTEQNIKINLSGCSVGRPVNVSGATWLPMASLSSTAGLRTKQNVPSSSQVYVNGPRDLGSVVTVSDVNASQTSVRARSYVPQTTDSVPVAEVGAHQRVYRSGDSLHPLVDHDYGAFATFSAEIQSSIISMTTDGVSQNDWRSIRRYRAARSKAMQLQASLVAPVDGSLRFEVPFPEVRQKRKYCRRQTSLPRSHVSTALPMPAASSLAKTSVSKSTRFGPARKGRPTAIEAARRNIALVRKRAFPGDSPTRMQTDDDSKNYVKIPGCYQDEFVYYATKITRGRPRKQLDPGTTVPVASTSTTARPTAVGGINVFDWYREMAQTDKSTRFGATVSSAPNPSTTSSPPLVTWSSSHLLADTSTPVDESAVADLVMEMLPKTDLDVISASSSCSITTSGVAGDFSCAAGGNGLYSMAGERGTELTVTEEDVQAMIRTLSDADLKMLASHLAIDEDHKAASVPAAAERAASDTSLSQYLTEFGRDNLLSTSQTSGTAGLLDVDDINDGDLLTADIGNMNVLLRDLDTPSRDVRVNNIPVTSKANLSALFDSDYLVGGSTGSATDVTPTASSSSTQQSSAAAAPPELCVVNMFWNDLPGLMIDGREHVRLVDIHRQVLPAKDTGILKKRCHMLGLVILQCSELQRDFLIRYMNAAKSKSTVVVSRSDAITLIGFYVNPKSRNARGPEGVDSVQPPLVANTTVARQPPAVTVSQAAHQLTHTSLPMTQQHHYTCPPAAAAAAATSVPSHNRPSQSIVPTSPASDKSSPPGGVKRSERLRDRRIRYADMVLGVHHRRNSTSDDDVDAKSPKPSRFHVAKHPSRSAPIVIRQSRAGGDASSYAAGGNRLLPDRRRSTIAVDENHHQSTAGYTSTVNGCLPTRAVEKMEAPSLNPCRSSLMRNLQTVPGLKNAAQKPNAALPSQNESHERLLVKVKRAKRFLSRRGGRRRFSTMWKTQVVGGTACCEPKQAEEIVETAETRTMTDSLAAVSPDQQPQPVTSSISDYAKMVNGGHANLTDVPGVLPTVLCSTGSELEEEKDVERILPILCSTGLKLEEETSVMSTENHLETECCPRVKTAPVTVSSVESCSANGSEKYTPTSIELVRYDAVVGISHSSLQCRAGYRRRSQPGEVLLDSYIAPDSPCVRCTTCNGVMSIGEFVRHLHRPTAPHHLIPVNTVRRIGVNGEAGDAGNEFRRRLAAFSARKDIVVIIPSEIKKPVQKFRKSADFAAKRSSSDADPPLSPPPKKVPRAEVLERSPGAGSRTRVVSGELSPTSAARITRSVSIRQVDDEAPLATRTRHHSNNTPASPDAHKSRVHGDHRHTKEAVVGFPRTSTLQQRLRAPPRATAPK